MADFIEAFKQGQEAAMVAERARKEIDLVFDDLDEQIRIATNGKVRIGLREFESDFGYSLFESATYTAIVAYNPKNIDKTIKQLARWSQDRAGYPCKIAWGQVNYTCEDREALENSLAELLRDPLIGETLYILMQRGEQIDEKTKNQSD